MNKQLLISFLFLLFSFNQLIGQGTALVEKNADGSLTYTPDSDGNIIPDFYVQNDRSYTASFQRFNSCTPCDYFDNNGNCVGGYNVALRKPSSISSQDWTGFASHLQANDGVNSPHYYLSATTRTKSELGAWWEVDLLSDYPVQALFLFGIDPGNPVNNYVSFSNYTVELLDVNRNVVWQEFDPGSPNPSKYFEVGGVTARHARVRLNGTGKLMITELMVITDDLQDSDGDGVCDSIDGTDGMCTLGEVCSDSNSSTDTDYRDQVCNCTGGYNVALGKTATQSSNNYSASGFASMANDGITNGDNSMGSVSHTTNETGAWWEMDLGDTYHITDLQVYNRTDCCKDRLSDFTVELLNDSREVIWHSSIQEIPDPFIHIPTQGKHARYARVVLNGSNFLSLAEVKVISNKPAPTPTYVDQSGKAAGSIDWNYLPLGGWSNIEWQDPGNWTRHSTWFMGIIPNDANIDISEKISAYIDQTCGNRIIEFPAGTFYMKTPLVFDEGGIIIRGQGNDKTIIKMVDHNANQIKFEPSGLSSFPTKTITNNPTRGASTIMVSDTQDLEIGDAIFVYNETTAIWGAYTESQIVNIINIQGNTLALDMKLGLDFNQNPKLRKLPLLRNIGIENLKITEETEPTSSTFRIFFNGVQNAYIKGIESAYTKGRHIVPQYSKDVIIEGNNIHDGYNFGGGGNGYGVNPWLATRVRITNNKLWNLRHHIILGGGDNHCVISYNSTEPDFLPYNNISDLNMHGFNPHNNLWEGNKGNNLHLDGRATPNGNQYQGQYNVFFRNRVEYMAIQEEGAVGNFPAEKTTVVGNYSTHNLAGHYLEDHQVGLNYYAAGLDLGTYREDYQLPSSLYLACKPEFLDGYAYPVYGPDAGTQYGKDNTIPALDRDRINTDAQNAAVNCPEDIGCEMPSISVPPMDEERCPGGDATFSVDANGNELRYQWQYSTDKKTWTNISDALSDTYSTSEENKYYRVIVSSLYCSSTSQSVTIARKVLAKEDSYVTAGDNQNENYGNEESILVKDGDYGPFHREGFIKFDLSNISGNITKATLKMYASYADNLGTFHRFYHINDDNWLENTLTWANRPTSTVQSIDAYFPEVGQWTAIDMTNASIAEQQSDGTLTVKIRELCCNSSYATYASSENSNIALRPYLSIVTDAGFGDNASCDDDDPCTINDALNANCNCTGVFQDTDNDGICDTNDRCPGYNDTIDTDNDNLPDDCDNCLDDFIQLNNSNIFINRQANVSIKTNGILIAGNNVQYQAGQQVELLSGFEVKIGAGFEIIIEGCQ